MIRNASTFEVDFDVFPFLLFLSDMICFLSYPDLFIQRKAEGSWSCCGQRVYLSPGCDRHGREMARQRAADRREKAAGEQKWLKWTPNESPWGCKMELKSEKRRSGSILGKHVWKSMEKRGLRTSKVVIPYRRGIKITKRHHVWKWTKKAPQKWSK